MSSSSPAGSYKWHVCSLEEHGWREEGEVVVAMGGCWGLQLLPCSVGGWPWAVGDSCEGWC